MITWAGGIIIAGFSIGSAPAGYSVTLNANSGTMLLMVSSATPLVAMGRTGTRPDVADSGNSVTLGKSPDGTKLTLTFHWIADSSLVYSVQAT